MKNYIDHKLILLLALPFIAALALGLIVESLLDFEPTFHPEEKTLLTFSPDSFEIKQRNSVFLKESLKSPIVMLAAVNTKNTLRGEASPDSSRPNSKSALQKTSFILIKDGNKKTAIINGMVLKEGDGIGNAIILRIESKRVLIKEGWMEPRWLELG